MIFDNLEQPQKDFTDWVPNHGGGNIIYTSRRSTLGYLGPTIKINPLADDAAITLLLRASSGRTETGEDYSIAKKLVSSLGGLPLAIQQCGSYIGASNQALRAYPAQLGPLMERLELYGSEKDLDFFDRSKPILETWDISFNALIKENLGAADLLCILAFLDASDIAEEVLRRGFSPCIGWSEEGNAVMTELTDTLRDHDRNAHRTNVQKFDLALQRLVSYSLVFRKRDATRLYMHPVCLERSFEWETNI